MKFMLTLIIITVAAWVGINSYHHRPPFANPFAEESVLEKVGLQQSPVDAGIDTIKEQGKQLIDKGKALGEQAADYAKEGATKAKKAIAGQ